MNPTNSAPKNDKGSFTIDYTPPADGRAWGRLRVAIRRPGRKRGYVFEGAPWLVQENLEEAIKSWPLEVWEIASALSLAIRGLK